MSSDAAFSHDGAWRGILPIVSVPFHANEEVDYQGFVHTLRYIHNTSCFGMVLFGIASEFYKLCDEEREKLAEAFLAQETRKKKIISVTDHASCTAVKKAKHYQDMGCDALMVLPPFFLKPARKEIMYHIRAVLNAVSVPVIIQIAPGETGVEYAVNDIISLYREFPHCMFKIEGSPVPELFIKTLRTEEPDMRIFNGYAGIYMPQVLAMGCSGIMPGCSFIELYTEIHALYESNNVCAAKQLHETFLPYGQKWMSACEYIIKVEKYILMKRGIIKTDVCRRPSYNLQARDYADIAHFLEVCDVA